MPETVCVTLEQLREWMNAIMKTSIRHLSDPQEVQFFADQFRSLELAIAQAERLKDWKPKIGDRVQLKTMPEMKGIVSFRYDDESVDVLFEGENGHNFEKLQFFAELMPVE